MTIDSSFMYRGSLFPVAMIPWWTGSSCKCVLGDPDTSLASYIDNSSSRKSSASHCGSNVEGQEGGWSLAGPCVARRNSAINPIAVDQPTESRILSYASASITYSSPCGCLSHYEQALVERGLFIELVAFDHHHAKYCILSYFGLGLQS